MVGRVGEEMSPGQYDSALSKPDYRLQRTHNNQLESCVRTHGRCLCSQQRGSLGRNTDSTSFSSSFFPSSPASHSANVLPVRQKCCPALLFRSQRVPLDSLSPARSRAASPSISRRRPAIRKFPSCSAFRPSLRSQPNSSDLPGCS